MRTVHAACLGVALLTGARASGDTCTPSRLLVVLDKSSSMNDIASGTTTKWRAAQRAVGEIANGYENKIDLGLMLFPSPSQCAPGTVFVQPGAGNAAAIDAALVGDPPSAGNWTPMAQSIDAATAVPLLQDRSRNPTVVVITDGWQWCSPYDPATRFTPIEAVARARQAGINVYVVGFGSAVDVLTLNRMADTAGTGLQGCDPTGQALDSANKCYYQVDNLASLRAAIDAIAVKVSMEICDGVDNDCNGQVDEGLARSCISQCGSGIERCAAGVWVGCDAQRPETEICDGIDNNCDGATDEGCNCITGTTRPCGLARGICTQGTQTCDETGRWKRECVGAVVARLEVCNGLDDDCNGNIDDPSPSLCPTGSSCVSGACKEDPLLLRMDESDDDAPLPAISQAEGCGCRVGASTPSHSPLLGAMVLGALAIALFHRRRR